MRMLMRHMSRAWEQWQFWCHLGFTQCYFCNLKLRSLHDRYEDLARQMLLVRGEYIMLMP